MNLPSQRALDCAVAAACAAGRLMLRYRAAPKKINLQSRYDIKLELDVRCQKLIEKTLLRSFPDSALLGEEGLAGPQESPLRWVVDPIDGTVNFTYGVPHACVSIALQERLDGGDFCTVIGVVYDPFCGELWTAARGGPARLNGKVIHVSRRKNLAESIVAIGFSKTRQSLNESLPLFNALVRRVRKIRMMGAAALSLTYVASRPFRCLHRSRCFPLGHRRRRFDPGMRRRRILASPFTGWPPVPHDRQQRPSARQARKSRPLRPQECPFKLNSPCAGVNFSHADDMGSLGRVASPCAFLNGG